MLQWVVERLHGLTETIIVLRRTQRELADSALRALSIALNETFIYYKRKDRDGLRNFDVEAQLSRYWSAAAIPLRHIDSELAEVCEHKAEFWLDPETWSEEEILDSGIGLQAVRDKYRSLLNPRYRITSRPAPRDTA